MPLMDRLTAIVLGTTLLVMILARGGYLCYKKIYNHMVEVKIEPILSNPQDI